MSYLIPYAEDIPDRSLVYEDPCDNAGLRFAVLPPAIPNPRDKRYRRRFRDIGNVSAHNLCRECPLFRGECRGMYRDTDICPRLD